MLAHELRWKLIIHLSQTDLRVQELVALLNEPQNLVSYHLKQLRAAQLVAERRSTADARDIYHSLDLAQLQASYAQVGLALHPALIRTEQLADTALALPNPPLRILFLCTENSARSQMAEGILRTLGGEAIQVFSAGTAPSGVHPDAVRTMSDLGIDIRQQRSKSVDEFKEIRFDYVITVCDRARENCPVFMGDVRHIHWSFADPAAVTDEDARLNAFAQTAQQLVVRIRSFFKDPQLVEFPRHRLGLRGTVVVGHREQYQQPGRVELTDHLVVHQNRCLEYSARHCSHGDASCQPSWSPMVVAGTEVAPRWRWSP